MVSKKIPYRLSLADVACISRSSMNIDVVNVLGIKTGLIKRFHSMRRQLEDVQKDAQRLVELAEQQDNVEMETLSLRIRAAAEALLKE